MNFGLISGHRSQKQNKTDFCCPNGQRVFNKKKLIRTVAQHHKNLLSALSDDPTEYCILDLLELAELTSPDILRILHKRM